MEGFQDLGAYQKTSEKNVKKQGLKVIDSRLVIEGEGRWCESQTVREGLCNHQERRLVCADAQPTNSQDSANARTQKMLDHESDRFCAGISSRTD